MKLTALGLLACCAVASQLTAAPGTRPRSKPKPPYHGETSFAQPISEEVKFSDDTVSALKALDAVAQGTRGRILVPDAALWHYLELPADHRRLRDVMDAVAQLMQGRWEKVRETYVLVLDPHLLDIAGYERKQDLITKGLALLVSGLSARQIALLGRGIRLTRGGMDDQQGRYLRDLGALSYYIRPHKVDPQAVRGQGVFLSYATGSAGPEVQFWVPTRQGRAMLWGRQRLSGTPAPRDESPSNESP